MTKTTGSYIVAWDFSRGEDGEDRCVLIVGEKTDGTMNIVNAFQDQEARDIYERLSTVKKDA